MSRRCASLVALFLLLASVAGAATVGERVTYVVAGSTAGVNGSSFKTSVQLYNPTRERIDGQLVLYLAGEPREPVRFNYSVAAGETIGYEDFIAAQLMLTTGPLFGSLDIVPTSGAAPIAQVRIYSDGGASGTTGMSVEPAAAYNVIRAGERTAHVTTHVAGRERINIGVRSLEAGARVRFTSWGDYRILRQTERTYAANTFEQTDLGAFIGADTRGIVVEVLEGSIITYAALTDNTSNDPLMTIAEAFSSTPAKRVVPILGSTPGQFGSSFRTEVAVFNAYDITLFMQLTFRELNILSTPSDYSYSLRMQPFQISTFRDFLQIAVPPAPLGSAEADPALDVAVRVRVIAEGGARGITGLGEPFVRVEDALRAGQRAALVAPFDNDKFRMNIGIRTLERGATLTATCTNDSGTPTTRTYTYAPNFVTQIPVSHFCSGPVLDNSAIRFHVDSGSAIVYGSITDNVSQDPTMYLARRYEE